MTVRQIASKRAYIGLNSDTKPTGVPIGTRYFEYDTGYWYITYDGTSYEILETPISAVISELDAYVISDRDLFDTLDADADNERWDSGYIDGDEGGSANINSTTAGKLMVKMVPEATPETARYGVSHALPFYADFFTVMIDLSCTWGATNTGTAKALGILISAGTAYDATNYIAIERQKGTSINRFTASGKLNNVALSAANVDTTDDAVAMKIERWDNVWKLYYSTTQNPNYIWTLLTQYEDPNVYMTDQCKLFIEAYSPGTATTETAQGDFDNFYYYIGAGGGGQYIAGDYNSAWVSPDIDGNVFERQEALQKAINITDAATLTGFKEDGTGANLFSTLIAKQGVTTGAGTTTTFADTARTEGDDYWIGSKIFALPTSAAAYQVRTIVDSTSGTLTVEPALTAAPGTSLPYVILNQKGSDFILGDNTANNAYASSSVIPNPDGSVLERQEFGQNQRGLDYAGICSTGTIDTTHTTISNLIGYGDDYFNNEYWIRVIYTTDGAAPLSEMKKVTDYTSSTGAFTHAAFTVAVDAGDQLVILHDTSMPFTVGKYNVKATTVDLHQGAASYTLVTGTTQDVIIESVMFRIPAIDVSDDAAITGISIQTNDTTPQVFIPAAQGLKVYLTAEAQLSWHGAVLLKVGKVIQLTIVGGTATADPTTCDVVFGFRAVVAGGNLG